jgi:hypothetical protein
MIVVSVDNIVMVTCGKSVLLVCFNEDDLVNTIEHNAVTREHNVKSTEQLNK